MKCSKSFLLSGLEYRSGCRLVAVSRNLALLETRRPGDPETRLAGKCILKHRCYVVRCIPLGLPPSPFMPPLVKPGACESCPRGGDNRPAWRSCQRASEPASQVSFHFQISTIAVASPCSATALFAASRLISCRCENALPEGWLADGRNAILGSP